MTGLWKQPNNLLGYLLLMVWVMVEAVFAGGEQNRNA